MFLVEYERLLGFGCHMPEVSLLRSRIVRTLAATDYSDFSRNTQFPEVTSMGEKSPMRLLSDRLLGARAAAVNLIAITCVCGGNERWAEDNYKNQYAIEKASTGWREAYFRG